MLDRQRLMKQRSVTDRPCIDDLFKIERSCVLIKVVDLYEKIRLFILFFNIA